MAFTLSGRLLSSPLDDDSMLRTTPVSPAHTSPSPPLPTAPVLARDGYAASPYQKEGMGPPPQGRREPELDRYAQRFRGGSPPGLQQYIDILPHLDKSQLQTLLTHLRKRLPEVGNTQVLAKFIRRVRKEIRRRASPKLTRLNMYEPLDVADIDECIVTPVADSFANAQFTSEDIASFRHLYHVNLDDEPWYEGFGEYRFGIFHHLNKLRPAQTSGRVREGSYNTVVAMKMRNLPWDDRCAAALKRDPKVMNQKIIVRQARRPLSIYELVSEILLTAMLANMGIAPKLYGAVIHEFTRQQYAQDAAETGDDLQGHRYERVLQTPPTRDRHMARVRMGTADMVFEAFDGDLLGLRDDPDYDAMKPEIAGQLDIMFAKVASLNILCVDMKFENIVYRRGPGNKVELRMIDFGTAFCGIEIMATIDKTKNLDGQLRAMGERFRDTVMSSTSRSQEQRIRHAFMVVIMALSSATRGDDLMRSTVKRMYTTAPGGERLLNGVPMRHYELWFQQDILNVKTMVWQYTSTRFRQGDTLTGYLKALMTMPLI